MSVLAVGFDLFFKPKLIAAGESEEEDVVFATPEAAMEKAKAATRVLADASTPGVLDTLATLRNAHPDIPILACYPHVETHIADAARGLGARTITRGQFDKQIRDAVGGRI